MRKTLHHMKFVNKRMGLLQSFSAGLGENAEADTERNGTDMAERNGYGVKMRNGTERNEKSRNL
jgi:hypothetical protein